MGKDKKLKQFCQRKLPSESENDNFISKKEIYHLGVSHQSVFSEIGTLLQTVGNMFKAHEDNTKSLVLLNDAQIEYLTNSIVDILMLFINSVLPYQRGLAQEAIKLLTDKVSKAEKMIRKNFMYDGTFNGNMLVVGQTRCGKTSFVQKLEKNKMFRSIDSVDWIYKIELSEAREHQIRESFCYASVEFHYPNDVGEFETILELLKDNKSDVNININAEADDLGIGEKDVYDIVTDVVSGLADKSNEFCSFLTVSRKYRYSGIYIFHMSFHN